MPALICRAGPEWRWKQGCIYSPVLNCLNKRWHGSLFMLCTWDGVLSQAVLPSKTNNSVGSTWLRNAGPQGQPTAAPLCKGKALSKQEGQRQGTHGQG